MSSPEHKALIWNLIKEIKVGMLVTEEKQHDGMRARPMQLVQDDYDGTLYFYTSKQSAKAFEIEKEKDVCITFSDHQKSIYVSLTGKAHISEDQALIDRYWSPGVAAWFEGGKDNEDLAILKLKVERGEHWDSNENKLFQLFEVAKANLMEDSTPNIGEHEKFGVS